MPRRMLNDELWSKLKGILKQHRIYDKPCLRDTIEGMLYRIRVGCPWRDLPKDFGPWDSIFQKFNRWSSQNKLMTIFKSLVSEPDLEWVFIDGSIVKAHQHSTGSPGNNNQAIGKSRGGNTTKIHMAVDSYGLPIDFDLTGGEVHDCKAAPVLLAKLPHSDFIIADKGYDSASLRELLMKQQSCPVIPRRVNSKTGNGNMDWALYKHRHLVENIFARLKHFRGIATRYDKLVRNFQSSLALACSYVWLPM